MKTVFVDSVYWIAIVKPGDQWSGPAKAAMQSLGEAVVVTTDEVLAEFLNMLSSYGPPLRKAAVKMVRAILDNPNVKVVPQTRDGFLAGLRKYDVRQDKEYSLTDCISMNVMKDQGISEVLTNDHHFAQEGFEVLVKRDRES
jgi:predicted nucleic acid-binding protein